MRILAAEAAELTKEAGFLNDEADADRRAEMEHEAEQLLAEREAISTEIPETWDDTFGTFNKLVSAENKARSIYRRAGDGAVEDAAGFLAVIESNPAYFALESDLMALEALIADGDRAEAEETVKALSSEFSGVPGADKVRSALSKARRSLKEGKEDREKAAKSWVKAVDEYNSQVAWRTASEGDLASGVKSYLAAIAETVGSRQQPRLSRDQALFIAGCNAKHRDISLNF